MLHKLRAHKDAGFTLIELLIVIIVLGILTAMVLFGLATFKSDSQTSACKADARQLRTAETAYLVKNPGATENAAELHADGYLQDVPTSGADGVSLDVSADAQGNITVSPACPN